MLINHADETLEAFQAAIDDGANFISMHVVRLWCQRLDSNAYGSQQELSPG